jgi:transcriptional regulator
LVGELTDRHESSRAEPWSVSDAPDAYVDKLLRPIVGVSLAVTSVSAKRKLSQNRPGADAAGVVAGLERDGHRRAADVRGAMERR